MDFEITYYKGSENVPLPGNLSNIPIKYWEHFLNLYKFKIHNHNDVI